MKTIIYAHPWDGSFNHAILSEVKTYLKNEGESFHLIDLYQDEFDPTFSKEELKRYSVGDTPYSLVKKYQGMIRESDELIFIFPIWWYGLPAILKGFIDKVMLINFAYNENEKGQLTGMLTYIKKTKVLTTSTIYQSYIEKSFISTFMEGILNEIGLPSDKTEWINFDKVNLTTEESRKEYLRSLPQRIKA
ncbi:NAD(P)H-dependent oxidoreductase [Enterococcus sp. LJL99]